MNQPHTSQSTKQINTKDSGKLHLQTLQSRQINFSTIDRMHPLPNVQDTRSLRQNAPLRMK